MRNTTALCPICWKIMSRTLPTEEAARWVEEFQLGYREIALNDSGGLRTCLTLPDKKPNPDQFEMQLED